MTCLLHPVLHSVILIHGGCFLGHLVLDRSETKLHTVEEEHACVCKSETFRFLYSHALLILGESSKSEKSSGA